MRRCLLVVGRGLSEQIWPFDDGGCGLGGRGVSPEH